MTFYMLARFSGWVSAAGEQILQDRSFSLVRLLSTNKRIKMLLWGILSVAYTGISVILFATSVAHYYFAARSQRTLAITILGSAKYYLLWNRKLQHLGRVSCACVHWSRRLWDVDDGHSWVLWELHSVLWNLHLLPYFPLFIYSRECPAIRGIIAQLATANADWTNAQRWEISMFIPIASINSRTNQVSLSDPSVSISPTWNELIETGNYSSKILSMNKFVLYSYYSCCFELFQINLNAFSHCSFDK